MARPAHEIRRGLIKARIHIRRKHVTVSVVRLFRNGDEWKESSRFGPKEIPLVRHVLDLAHSWILNNEASDDRQPERC